MSFSELTGLAFLEREDGKMSLALKGIKVLDVSQVAAVPMAARHMGDFGAEVIHVEPPQTGDSWRYFAATFTPPSDDDADDGISPNFEAFNRNKRSLALDLSQQDGQAVLGKLLEEADVFLTNLRPFEQESFGVDYETLHKRYPRLIYGSLTGFGRNGPERNSPAYVGTALWYRSGLYGAFKPPGTGTIAIHAAIGDNVVGMSLFAGIMTALFVRERTGIGQQVDLSLFHVGVYQLSYDIAGFLETGEDFREAAARLAEEAEETPQTQLRAQLLAEATAAMERLEDEFGGFSPLVGRYRTSDGRIVFLSIVLPDRYYPRICRVIGREDLTDDPRFANHESRMENGAELFHIMRDIFLTKTLDEWRPILNREEIPWASEQTIREVVSDPQARANDFFLPFDHPTKGPIEVIANPLKLTETPSTIRLPAPEFSQHSEEVLLEHGYTWEDIAAFKEKGVIP